MSYIGNKLVFTGSIKSGIDGTATGSTLIFTPTGNFTPQIITFELQSTTGFISVASASIGTNGSNYNNLLPISALTGIQVANNLLSFSLTSLISSITAGTGIFVNITTGAISTTYVLKVTITGIYN